MTLLSTPNTQVWNGSGTTGGFTYGGTGSLTFGPGAVTITGDAGTVYTQTITANAANSGTTLTIGGPISLGSLATTSNILNVAGAGNVTLAGPISNGGGTGGNISLTMNGTGTLTLSGINSYTGSTSVNSGTLQISGQGTLGSGNYGSLISLGTVSSGGTLIYGSSANQTLSGNISGMGALTMSGAGTLILSNAANNYTGATTINSGTHGEFPLIHDGRRIFPAPITVKPAATLQLNASNRQFEHYEHDARAVGLTAAHWPIPPAAPTTSFLVCPSMPQRHPPSASPRERPTPAATTTFTSTVD